VLSKFRGTNEPVYRPDIKDNKFKEGKASTNNKVIKAAYWEHIDLREVKIKVETKTTTEHGLVTGVITPLNTISITLQNNRSNV